MEFLLQFSIKLKQYLLRRKTRSDSFMGTCMLAKMLRYYRIFKEYYIFLNNFLCQYEPDLLNLWQLA